jgi:hypothetical protein
MSQRPPGWTVISYAQQPPTLLCTRCGDSQALTLPMEISRLTEMVNAFGDRHRTCQDAASRGGKWYGVGHG